MQFNWSNKLCRLIYDLMPCNIPFFSLEDDTIAFVDQVNKKVIVKFDKTITYPGLKRIYGMSQCLPEDEFNVGIGIKIAKLKFLRNVLRFFKSVKTQEFKEIHKIYLREQTNINLEIDTIKSLLSTYE